MAMKLSKSSGTIDITIFFVFVFGKGVLYRDSCKEGTVMFHSYIYVNYIYPYTYIRTIMLYMNIFLFPLLLDEEHTEARKKKPTRGKQKQDRAKPKKERKKKSNERLIGNRLVNHQDP